MLVLCNEYDNDGYHTQSQLTVNKEPLDDTLVVFSLDEFRNDYPIGLTSITLNRNQVNQLREYLNGMYKAL